MEEIPEFVDERHKGWCIHCHGAILSLEANRDHVPSKGLLLKPYPPNLPIVEVCRPCNVSFSLDEEYLIAFLGSVLTGSTEPADQKVPNSGRILARSESLRHRIDQSKNTFTTMGGDTRTIWQPETDRIHRVVVKNARGHAYFEHGEPMLNEPDEVWATPLEFLSEHARRAFEAVDYGDVWPEIGSRIFTRIATGQDLSDGWIIVQDGVYRYVAVHTGGITVRTVLHEYLATQVTWLE